MSSTPGPLLSIKDLSVSFHGDDKVVEAVKSVTFDLYPKKTLALVGESGSGKSVCALSILRLLPYPKAKHPSGHILFEGKSLLTGPEDSLSDEQQKHLGRIRGSEIGMIFQEPLTALNPLHSIERQLTEVLDLHTTLSKRQKRDRIYELLDDVEFPEAKDRLTAYPHELSGGQRQRIMIAMALAANPKLLIADEPTTALDVTTQLSILRLINRLKEKHGLSVLFITHDLSIVSAYADDVVVMKNGYMIESGTVKTVFESPQQAYTKDLLQANPKGRGVDVKDPRQTILSVTDLTIEFGSPKSMFHRKDTRFQAVKNLCLTIETGKTLGVVGESGSGKSTLAMAIMRLLSIKSGEILFQGHNLTALSSRALRPYRKDFQIVFQDPFGSLNPRMTIDQIIGEGIGVHNLAATKQDRDDLITQALKDVRLDPEIRNRYPHEFSGGQRQRIAIARALVVNPKLLILDEPTSALDRSVQVSVLELLKTIQQEKGISYLFITHDLRVLQSIAHDMIVMKNGEIVEQGPTESVFKAPKIAYTKTLINAALMG